MSKSGNDRQRSDYAICVSLLKEARPYLWGILLFMFVAVLAAPIALLHPLPLKIAVDSGLGDTPLPGILNAIAPPSLSNSAAGVLMLSALLVVAFTLLNQIQWAVDYMLRTYIAERMVLDFRAKLFRHVQRLSFSFHDRKGSSDSTYRIQWDAVSLQSVIIDSFIPFIVAMATLGSMLFVTLRLNWQLGLVAVMISPVLLGITHFYRPRLRAKAIEQKTLESTAFAVIPETLSALRVVKAFGQEDREQGRFVSNARKSLMAKVRYIATECGMSIAVGMTIAVGSAAVLYVGATQVLNGALKIGELLLIMGYTAQLYAPLRSMSNKIGGMQRNLASADRALSLLEESADVPDKPNAKPLSRAKGDIVFDNVSFHYSNSPEVFSKVNLKVPTGTKVGIAGRTGAGKTTLISLLMRFYDVTGGAIRLDGHDIKEYRLADLRRQFSIVLQDPVLFATSICENIAYGKPDASETEIIAAAQAANAHDFISELPDGYDTRVGERGMRLSGGERQRISLARAFLIDSPILVLDEPTSSVDVNTEKLIMDALNRLMSGRTTFMIAHRLSTLETCDLTVKLEDGTLIERTAANAL